MIDIRKNILSKSFAAQFHKKIPRVYKGWGKLKMETENTQFMQEQYHILRINRSIERLEKLAAVTGIRKVISSITVSTVRIPSTT